MSNVSTARKSIEAELNHAKQGLAFYQSRVEALTQALVHLDKVDSVPTTANGKTPGSKTKPAKPRSAAAPAQSKDLPSTGGDFWKNQVTDTPRSLAEILDAAIATLPFKPSVPQRKKLKQRATFTLNTLVQKKEIEDSGSGRDRQFFKKK